MHFQKLKVSNKTPLRDHGLQCQNTSITSDLKIVRGALGVIDLLSLEVADCSRQSIDIHCPRFNESPTNISLFPLNFSHISVTLHLSKQNNRKHSQTRSKPAQLSLQLHTKQRHPLTDFYVVETKLR